MNATAKQIDFIKMRRDMKKLPSGKTCGTCEHFVTCKWFIQADENSGECDWEVSRYKEAGK